MRHIRKRVFDRGGDEVCVCGGVPRRRLDAAGRPCGAGRPAPGGQYKVEEFAFENVFEIPTPENFPVALGLYAEYEARFSGRAVRLLLEWAFPL